LFVDSSGTVSVKGAGTAAFSVNGGAPNNSIVVTSAGLVGIGTGSPADRLTIQNTSGTAGIGLLSSGNSYLVLDAGVGAAAGNQISFIDFKLNGTLGANIALNEGTSGSPLEINSGVANNIALVTGGGRVGIGTTSPVNRLHVSSSGDVLRLDSSSTDCGILLFDSVGGARIGTRSASIIFDTSSSERARIDSSGRLLVGTSTARTNYFNTTSAPQHQIEGIGYASITRNLNDTFSPLLVLAKSRSTSNTIVQSGDVSGQISFQGNDGSEFVEAALIRCDIDGTPGANDMPGRLVFSTTADGASSPTARMTIKNDGKVGIGVTSPSSLLQVNGTVTATGFSGPLLTALTFNNSGSGVGSGTAFDASGPMTVSYNTIGAPSATGANASGTWGINIIGNAGTATSAITAGRARPRRSDNLDIDFIFSDPGGQPTWVWGTNDGGNMYVWNPSNFNVNSATTAGTATNCSRSVIAGTNLNGGGALSGNVTLNLNSNLSGTFQWNDALFRGANDISASTTTERWVLTAGTFYVCDGDSGGSSNVVTLQRSSSGGNVMRFIRGTTNVGTISITASATTYATSSDYRLKENIVDLNGAIDRLKLLPVHRFNFLADPDTTVDGFIAHEVAPIVPEAVTGEKDAEDEDGNPVYQGIDQSKIVPLLTAALQEALAKIEDLESRLAAAGI
jgi:hypothetical protein